MESSLIKKNIGELQIVECPRDAMQGRDKFIPTVQKAAYINALLQVGYHTIDFGSFVSAKAIPQMADTKEVIGLLNMAGSNTKLLAIVANERGAMEAADYNEISFLGFPFSISPTFQQRNTNSGLEEALQRVDAIQSLCIKKNKQLVVYMSMGFGNPYNDPYDEEILLKWTDVMVKKDITIISLADTIGLATPTQIDSALQTLIPTYPNTTIGVHLHSSPVLMKEKLQAAISAGCKRFDGALKGIGGCPMAADELVGNINTELIIEQLRTQFNNVHFNYDALYKCLAMADEIFT